MGWGVSIRDWLLVCGMGCSYTGWGIISTRDGVLIHGMGC